MLLAIFAAVVLGMFVTGSGRRETALCAAIAVALTVMYFLRPQYMT